MLLKYVRQGVANSFFYAASTVIVRGLGMATLPYFLTKLSLEDFGVWDFYQTFFSLGVLIVGSVFASALQRYYLLYSDDLTLQHNALSNGFVGVFLSVMLFLATSLCVFSCSNFCASNTPLIISVLSISFFVLFSLVLTYMRVRQRLFWYMILFCGQGILATSLTLCGIYNGLGVLSFFYANLVSLIIFSLPFWYLLVRYSSPSRRLIKEQLYYAVPLLAHGLLFILFFSVDRCFIKYVNGYAVLGEYGLLWRFGGIFQFFSIALFDAWYLAVLSAQSESNHMFLIRKLTNYVVITLFSGALAALVVARIAIGFFFPANLHGLICYLPLFFVSLVILDVARIMQVGFHLGTRTTIIPLLTFGALCVQVGMLFVLQSWGLWGIFMANGSAFLFYGFASYMVGAKIYSAHVIDIWCVIKTALLFGIYVVVLEVCFAYFMPWPYLFLLFVTWPMALLCVSIIGYDERMWLRDHIHMIVRSKGEYAETTVKK